MPCIVLRFVFCVSIIIVTLSVGETPRDCLHLRERKRELSDRVLKLSGLRNCHSGLSLL